MKLKIAMEKRKLSVADVAKGIHVSLGAVSRYAGGTRMPTPTVMNRIWIYFDGEVGPMDFYDLPKLDNDQSVIERGCNNMANMVMQGRALVARVDVLTSLEN